MSNDRDGSAGVEKDPGRASIIARLRRLRAVDEMLESGESDSVTGSAREAGPVAAGSPDPDSPPRDVRRYVLGERLGMGGMGEVVRAHDSELDRVVAMKRMRASQGSSSARRRFFEEARTAAGLEHPNIVPVYDVGSDGDGCPYFTMKWIRGRTLAEILRGVAERKRRVLGDYPLSRRVQILQSVCMAIDFAHERGVIHRDLKPANILIGAFGEVHVVDWGLARSGEPENGSSRPDQTLAVHGTPSYMAPEQARGDAVDRRTDIYGLGAVLYEILTLRAPHAGRSAPEIVEAVRRGPPPSPIEIEPETPPALDDLCRRAMSRDPADRPGSAREIHDELVQYLEGSRERARRRAAADRALVAGLRSLKERRGLTRRLKTASRVADREARRFEPHAPIASKRPLLDLIRERDAIADAADVALGSALEELTLALRFDPEHSRARRTLGELHAEMLLEAEEAGNARDVILHQRMIEAINDGSFDRFLAGDGSLSLETDPPGASVRAQRYVDEGVLMRVGQSRSLGSTPVRDVPLAMGSYLLTIRKSGFAPVRFPVLIRRNETRSLRFPLLKPRQIGAGFVYVPAGPFIMGGDPRTLGAGERREVDVPGFLMARFPVTFAEYMRELNAAPRGASLAGPRNRFDPAGSAGRELLRRAGTRWVIARDDAGQRMVQPRWPVFGVSWEDATQYCRLRSEREGMPCRLPREVEWEKAARGADGRLFPWGNRFDASLCKMAESRPAQAQPEPVGSFPSDRSPHGVRDVAGGVQEWVADWLNRRNRFRVVRGGGYSNRESTTHCAYRSGANLKGAYPFIGFRVARDLPV